MELMNEGQALQGTKEDLKAEDCERYNRNTDEAVQGREYERKGIGRVLVQIHRDFLYILGYSFSALQVPLRHVQSVSH